MLEGQPEPTTLAALTLLCGLHENTVRGHLDALHRDGLVSRERAAPGGRGRPAWLWSAVNPVETSEYAALAAALAGTIRRTSNDPVADAVEAGRDWGRHQTRSRRAAGHASTGTRRTAAAARREVVALLDDAGFAPRTDARATRVALTRCPLLEAARRDTDVVCGVHLGLVQGALDELGVDDDRTRLLPFAEPGACVLHLRARDRARDEGKP